MPLDRAAAFQLGLLLLAVPAQILISRYMQTSESNRSYALKKFFDSAVGFKERYLSWRSWQKWCMEWLAKVHSLGPKSNGEPPDVDTDMGESPAIEVLKYRDPNGYFATSPEPRSPRPPNVKYRIGQVIRHKNWKYRGVIIGWDETAKAPEKWLKEMHPKDKKPLWECHYSVLIDERDINIEGAFMYIHQDDVMVLGSSEHWRQNPNYSVLVDTRDRMHPQVTYMVEENIQIVSNTRVIHPMIDEYFEEFDGAQYLPRPWLKAIYPHD